MFSVRMAVVLLSVGAIGAASEPQTTLRGVVNGVSFQPAPATVARGGILAVLGEELASAHMVADGLPLPVSLDDPAVEVLINGVAAPLFFVSPIQINAQVPWEIEPGWAEVVVRRGGNDSTTMQVIVAEVGLNLFRHDGSSAPIAQSVGTPDDPGATPAGEALTLELGSPGTRPSATGGVLDASADITAGDQIAVFATGLGATTPAIASGAAGSSGEAYTFEAAQRAYVGGLPVSEPTVEASTDLVGVYKMTLTVPDMAGSTEVFHWISGGASIGGLLGPAGAPDASYMAVPDGAASAERIDTTDLNASYVALSGAIDETEGCYSGVQLLDFRRDTATAVTDCLLPSYPNASNPDRFYRPFEVATNSPVLAAFVAPEEPPESGHSNQLLLVDSANGTSETLTLANAADRLQPGPQGVRDLSLERPDGTGIRDVVDFSGAVVDEFEGWVLLPEPLEAGDLTRVVAQGGANFAGGYRVRFLAPESEEGSAGTQAVLFDRTATVVTQLAFPEGWAPIEPPRRTNAQGVATGTQSLAPVTTGFAGNTTAYVLARKTDGTQDGVVAFQVEIPVETEDDASDPDAASVEGETPTASMTATATAFGSGTFAANCHAQVRWHRIPLTRTIAIAGAGEALSDYAEPRDNELCASDRLVLFDTQTAEVRSVSLPSTDESPAKLDVASKGAFASYLYFGDGTRESAFGASQKIHVFDGVTETFTEIALPEGAGLPFNNYLTQHMPGSGRLVALATATTARTTQRGLASAYPGTAGLLVVDVSEGTATNLALPEGFQRAIPGNNRQVQSTGRMFGLIPMLGRAFGVFRRPNNPGGSGIVTWDVATGTATEIALPENGYSVVQPFTTGGGGAPTTYVWDYNGKTASFAFGVYNQDGSLISIGIVGP